jgi:predicted helicase
LLIGFGFRRRIIGGGNAEETIRNQKPQVSRIGLSHLQSSPVDWEKLEAGMSGEGARTAKKTIYPHVFQMRDLTIDHFKENDRGKLIMACGTGKTLTSLKIAEKQADGKGLILFLVPSIALLGQTLREWTAQSDLQINAICICSDSGVSKKQTKNEDSDGYSTVDLALPASTDIKGIVKQFDALQALEKGGMTVVFSTYQSIDVIADAQKALIQKNNPLSIFDLIICDEAHRTTGVTLADNDESAFVKVHNNDFIQAKKRLYMTATPRLFNEDSKSKAAQAEAVLCSMDDPSVYGDEIHRIGFGEAVAKGLLADYKVLILTLSEGDIPPAVQKMIADDSNEINTDDASKLIGCINALSKQILGDAGLLKETDPEPMRRAVAFCQNIKASQRITTSFNETRATYTDSLPDDKRERIVSVYSDHVDGTMSAPKRDEKLTWLKADTEGSRECRVLTNARCLSEGVDVPSLDAVLFLSARNSQVDVVQSVGRVMRKSEGKKYGYIIIPVVVPADVEPDKALDDNDRYKVVWTVLNALRAHDDRFNATVNQIELNKKRPNQILVGRPDTPQYGGGESADGSGVAEPTTAYGSDKATQLQNQLQLQFEQIQSVVFARMVQKVGDRRYWEQWAKDVAQIAERYVERINRLIRDSVEHKMTFADFLKGLQKNINPSITQGEAVEMLSQHIITKPVFEALFEGYSFVKNNPISMAMQTMLDLLEDQSLEKDAETLQKFYESVKQRAAGIDNAEGKQRIIIELYDKFFKTAFPKMVEQLGIVYTPIEVVDFIIHSVDAILKKEFSRSLSDENIHILDPFTGTGTFMTRLLQSGLIQTKDLERKYTKELHANEIVLLAYYIAAINIENAYHDATPDPDDGIGKEKYTPFNGICLTDTFQLGETDKVIELFSDKFPKNSARVLAQKKAPLRIIMGNPPYSVGQKSANDNAQNQSYDKLDARISKTYAKETNATNKNSLYDSYIKAFRWSSDRLDTEGGIIAFVSNGAWLDGNSTDGFRKCLQKEFSAIYVFNLRGNARTQGELRRKESGNVFGGGSRTPISITILVKKPKTDTPSVIYYHDIGDYLSQDEKIKTIKKFGSVGNTDMAWQVLEPNEHGDWLNQRDDVFGTFIPMESEKKFDVKTKSFFVVNSRGNETSRDAWVYNSSKTQLKNKMQQMVTFYNQQVVNYFETKKTQPLLQAVDFIDTNPKHISWSSSLIPYLEKGYSAKFESDKIVVGHYRPFYKQQLYLGEKMIHRRGQFQEFFPHSKTENYVICVSGVGASKEFSPFIVDMIPDLEIVSKNQCFPLYYYEETPVAQINLFDTQEKLTRRDGVSDYILSISRKAFGERVTKEDIFYYVYGFLHSPEYRSRFSSDLKKMLPRIPMVDTATEFWSFSKAGRKLADLHINYETVKPTEGVLVHGAESGHFKVEKMRFPSKSDKSTILFNSRITIDNIPSEVYEYVVNGKSALEWVMERYAVTTHKDSGIKNDPNDWATEVGNERYILDLVLSVITVSLETVAIVKGLPKFEV